VNLEELERRVQALEDLEKIKKLHQQYMNLMDVMNYDDVLDLFTEDMTTDIRNSGLKHGKAANKEIYDFIKKVARPTRSDAHMAIEPDITVNGDMAEGKWLIYILFSDPAIQWVQGINECEYRKEDGEWKISKLKFRRTMASDKSLYGGEMDP
jgi:hypothetical protein